MMGHPSTLWDANQRGTIRVSRVVRGVVAPEADPSRPRHTDLGSQGPGGA